MTSGSPLSTTPPMEGGDRAHLLPPVSDLMTARPGDDPMDRTRGRLAAYTDDPTLPPSSPRGDERGYEVAPPRGGERGYGVYKDDTTGEREEEREISWGSKGKVVGPLVVVLILCLVLLVGFALLAVVMKVKLDNIRTTCSSPECIIQAGEVLVRMSLDQDPCEDLYEYACGSFNRPENRPPDLAEWNMFSLTQRRTLNRIRYLLETYNDTSASRSSAHGKSKRMYDSCMNSTRADSEGVTSMLQLIKDLGSWPVTSDPRAGSWVQSSWTLQEALYQTHSRGFYPFFSLSITADLKNSSQYVISLDQEGLLLYSEKLYKGDDWQKFRDAYVTYLIEVTGLLGASLTRVEAENIWDFEKAVAGAFVPQEERVEIELMYNPMSIKQLEEELSGSSSAFPLSILELLKRLVSTDLTENTRIIVSVPQYFNKLGKLISQVRADTLASYVVWCAVRGMVKYSGSGFESTRQLFMKTLSGVGEMSPRWERCIELTTQVLGFATGSMYVNKYLNSQDKVRVEQVIDAIVTQFISRLDNIRWMDDTTRKLAAEKARAVESKVAYPDFILNSEKLDKYYITLEIGESTFDNVMRGNKFYVERDMKRFGTTPDRSEWESAPTEVNAFYSPTTNQITLPAGILQPPFYSYNFSLSMVFGSIGFVVGHELTHGFDNNGRKFDKRGNLEDWWTEYSSRAYKERTTCFKNEYDAFEVNGLHLNGLTTLGENIADNGGAKLSYSAYKTTQPGSEQHSMDDSMRDFTLPGLNMTHDQLFFISLAQTWCSVATEEKIRKDVLSNEHSIKRFRVNGVVRNMPSFSKTFKCSRNDKLNPSDSNRCALW